MYAHITQSSGVGQRWRLGVGWPIHNPRSRMADPQPNHHSVRCHAFNRIAPSELLEVAKRAADAGVQVIHAALDKPKVIESKGGLDVVTETDKASEAAVMKVLQEVYPRHAILGEEGGLIGDTNSDYLWCIDPIDGTANFTHDYPGFSVSIGVLRHALPVAGVVVVFTGGPGGWATRTYTASRNGGAKVDGRPISVSRNKDMRRALLASESSMSSATAVATVPLLQHFASQCQGLRRTGSAATSLCYVAEGVLDGYVEFLLKPWDLAAGVLIVEEAGGRVTTADGVAFSVFDRTLLATNDALYGDILGLVEPKMQTLLSGGLDLTPYQVPGYRVRTGAQLE